MSLIPGTTIEYENKRHDEITSAYSYAKYFTCWNTYEIGVNNNPVIRWLVPNQLITLTAGSSDVYADILWIFDEYNAYIQEGVLINAQSTDTLPVITKLDLQKYKLVIDGFTTTYATPTGVSSVTNPRSPGYELQANEYIKDITYYWIDKDETESRQDKIRPIIRYIVDGETWYFYPNVIHQTYMRNVPNNGNKLDVTNPDGAMIPHDESILVFHSPTSAAFTTTYPSLGNSFFTGGDEDYGVIFSNVSNSTNLLYTLPASIDCLLRIIATLGVYFEYDDTLYLGFMDNTGQTTGEYLEEDKWNTSAQWQSENINNYTEHTPPYVPPTPPTPDAEPETFGWGGNEVGGMVHYYLLTQSEMESLAGFMSNPNWTIDYRNCIVSMFIIPNNGTVVFDDDTFEPTTVKFRLDENNKVDTGISCNRIHNVVNNHGTIEIPRMNNNFLDYEPYSKYMVYVPFCGVTSLPDYIAGKEITVSIYPDVPTCSCTAVISSEGRKIATLRGNFGSSIPVTSDGSGLKTAAIINSMANGLVGLGEMAAGAGLDNPGLVIGGGMTAISSILQTALTFGQAFGYSVGSSGDTSFFGIGNRCEYYIAYPQWNNPDGEDTNIYGHTYGFVVNKRGIIGDFEGFTVCDNPHVTGFSCTSDEKDEIERLLREGIIIHKPEE